MNRRQFLSTAVSSTLASTVASSAMGFSASSLASSVLSNNTQDTLSPYAKKFQAALNTNNRLRCYEGVNKDIPAHFQPWHGKLPEQLVGHDLYRNGPAQRARGNERYQHFFDGDGMVNHFSLSQQGMTHKGKFVRTHKFIEESAADKFVYSGTGTRFDGAALPTSAQSVSQANTALLPIQGELWAMWEAASPYRVDRASLDTLGQVKFNDALDGVPFSAHPHHDRDGSIWNFGNISYAGKPTMVLYHLQANGVLREFKLIELSQSSYIHDFAITDKYLVFYLSPLVLDRLSDVYVESFKWQPHLGGELLVIDKNTLTAAHRIPFEPGFIFHFGNSWQQGNNLVLNTCWYDDAYVYHTGMADLLGEKPSNKKANASQIVIDLTKRQARLVRSNCDMEFPMFDARFSQQQSEWQTGVTTGKQSARSQFNAVGRYSQRTDTLESFDFGLNTMVEEPLFVAKDNATREGQGYLIHSYINFVEGATGLAVFDAERIPDGPLAYANLPYYLPLGLHGTFI
ncbi:hypothetical protein PCIT_b0911 [Pseudoalteromonas citrea]|uniref:Dioxygenase n=2 Tax=Pseudoalteromonas citrea TaxID=43655 RepID=A0AAD4AFA2_9GAMM|nr:carotenoid oxygenase family protein [Pseudoalteromonas citrea]KAF7764827.1 hypothetical protein PCIT_b0911 [Pseudoalteromonas citrea]